MAGHGGTFLSTGIPAPGTDAIFGIGSKEKSKNDDTERYKGKKICRTSMLLLFGYEG
jgi:hypothetical protein